MKTLLILLSLILSSSISAQDLTVALENDKTDTSVSVTPLDEAPKGLPVK